MNEKVAVILAAFNRRSDTVRAIGGVFHDLGVDQVDVILLDDGSTDGTAAAVLTAHPTVHVIRGTGALYWNGGMRVALNFARSRGRYRAYVMLNDDTELRAGALRALVSLYDEMASSQPLIIAGYTVDSSSGAPTYGGLRWSRTIMNIQSHLIVPRETCVPCDTFNANCVLLSADAVELTGGLDATFTHSMGDIDLGLRAKRLGVRLLAAPIGVGYCSRNSARGSWRDPGTPLRQRWRQIMSPKGLPFREWGTLCYRHGALMWPATFVRPYLRVLFPRPLPPDGRVAPPPVSSE